MSITSSQIVNQVEQVGGRTSVDEVHTDHLGGTHPISYLAAVGANLSANLAAHAVSIADRLADQEYDRLIGTLVTGNFSLQHQTGAQFATRYREDYKTSSQLKCGYLATWILNHIDASDFTDTQVRNAFGLTAGQYTTLKSKWTNLRTNYTALLAATGE
jgi:hypothetical protein